MCRRRVRHLGAGLLGSGEGMCRTMAKPSVSPWLRPHVNSVMTVSGGALHWWRSVKAPAKLHAPAVFALVSLMRQRLAVVSRGFDLALGVKGQPEKGLDWDWSHLPGQLGVGALFRFVTGIARQSFVLCIYASSLP